MSAIQYRTATPQTHVKDGRVLNETILGQATEGVTKVVVTSNCLHSKEASACRACGEGITPLYSPQSAGIACAVPVHTVTMVRLHHTRPTRLQGDCVRHQ